MVLYSSSKFGVLKSWTKIVWSRRFDLGFWQTSKQIQRKLQYRNNVFGEFEALPRFFKKMVLYSSVKFDILKPGTNIQSLRWFDLGFWQTSKHVCRKLQYREKLFEEFQGLSRFLRKMVLYSSTKFDVACFLNYQQYC